MYLLELVWKMHFGPRRTACINTPEAGMGREGRQGDVGANKTYMYYLYGLVVVMILAINVNPSRCFFIGGEIVPSR